MSTAKKKFGTGFFYHAENGEWKEIKEIGHIPGHRFMDAAFDLHELYKAFVRSGFNEDQAMTLVIATITAGVKNHEME